MDWKTQTGRREDLEQIEVNFPEGYLGPRIYPVRITPEKVGDFTVQAVQNDVAAVTALADATTRTRTAIAMSDVDYTVQRKTSGWYIAKGSMPQYRTIANADRIGGTMAKRAIMRRFEGEVAAAVFGTTPWNARITAATGALFVSIQAAAKAVKRVQGRLAAVMSRSLFTKFIALSEVKNRMDTGVFVQLLQASAATQLSRTPQMLAQLMQTFYAFDEILIGDDDHWELSGKESAMAIVKLPPTDEYAEKMDPILGVTMCYWPTETGANAIPCEIESWVDDDVKTNNYDSEAYWVLKTFNATGVKIVDLSADIATTTTTGT